MASAGPMPARSTRTPGYTRAGPSTRGTRQAITIHDGKGGKHRVVPLPLALEERLRRHLEQARQQHLQDLAAGVGEVHMPEALARKYPNAPWGWCWQYHVMERPGAGGPSPLNIS